MKKCTRCGQEKPENDFYVRQSICKSCSVERAADWAADNPDKVRTSKLKYAAVHKEANRIRAREWARKNKDQVNAKRRAAYDPDVSRYKMLKYRYGLSREDYDQMLHKQHYSCAACGTALLDSASIHVDHCHRTGQVRALLCRRCNTCLGQFGEDGGLIRKLAEYADEC